MIPFPQNRAAQWGLLIGLVGVFWGLFALLRFPAAPLLGGMAAGIVAATAAGVTLRNPRPVYVLAQGAAGVFIATSLTPGIYADMLAHLPLVLLVTVLTVAVSFATGWALNRWAGVSADAAVFGSLPGMSGAMVIIAHERGIDSRIVALMQYCRLAFVIVAATLVSKLLPEGTSDILPPGDDGPGSLVLTLALIGLSLASARLKWMPAGGMLVPMGLGAVIEGFGLARLSVPPMVVDATFIVIGLEVGLLFTRQMVGHALRLLPVVLGANVVMVICGGIIAAGLSLILGLDAATAFLSTAPGGIETMTLIAVAIHANVSIVLAFQTVRLFAVVLCGPTILQILLRRLPWRKDGPVGRISQEQR
ncbi:AbrB family transcriptional regulator [Paenirhodobacter populi]|uniref:AbrB family transcriptional regulator n=1 Tax=Paenirhodobacter populi TaxID=2306993 RepID=A0A443JNR6_9RHOB|nr:AbrB family transcriptional regulator [Sinirhodobacter populi]RWR22133.1 AbrB family transcriptional regulator [Sinirhodobacter populi]